MSSFRNYAKNRFLYDLILGDNPDERERKKSNKKHLEEMVERWTNMTEEERAVNQEILDSYFRRCNEELERNRVTYERGSAKLNLIFMSISLVLNIILFYWNWASNVVPAGETFMNDSLDLVVSQGPTLELWMRDELNILNFMVFIIMFLIVYYAAVFVYIFMPDKNAETLEQYADRLAEEQKGLEIK